MEECEAQGAAKLAAAEAGVDLSFERTAGGDRYRDLVVGQGSPAKHGDVALIR